MTITPRYGINIPNRSNPKKDFLPKKTINPEPKPMYNFSDALTLLKRGYKMMRCGWNGKGMCLQAQYPDSNSKMTHPYMYMTIPECEEGTRKIPYHFANVDIFAEDWMVLV